VRQDRLRPARPVRSAATHFAEPRPAPR
jgi:hypothetical protein